MSNPNKDRGSQFERDIVAYFHQRGHTHFERRFGAGQQFDKGDITGATKTVIEAKNHAKISLSTFMDETAAEKINAKATLGVAVVKRRGKGASESYAVLTLADLVTLLEEAKRL